ncbi:hypothetical protein ONS95_000290 [Cadophora gregata]|uniref:uncharacterized protein n=1 Tax=Cadophora gregata TaxID=51156 RepID=UPI0026DD10AC|nr:uncharacterized protein ONS95_000290 [Cadophora gregata]KAK0125708.1 hypothetical protein ONS96_009540 [Cadophora gregata f. sp. sojae]KAK0128315.1 hypothetical protein ONS95_000290 [Cadophora gregata]
MHFKSSVAFTLAVVSGLVSLGVAKPLNAHVSVEIDDMSEDVLGSHSSLEKFQKQADAMSVDDPVYTYGVQLFPNPGYSGRQEVFIAYPGRCLPLPNFPNFKFASALLAPGISRCEFYDFPGCTRRAVLMIGKDAGFVDTSRVQLGSMKCS